MKLEFSRIYGTCKKCYGGGDWNGGECSLCCGTGDVLTAEGEELIRFLRRHFIMTPKPKE